jgi:hypothetical protein
MSSERNQIDPTSVEFAVLDFPNQTLTVIQTDLSNGFPKQLREDWA